ncbi:MAG: acyl-CoA thioesterase [Opitutae bacterium]|nr:acyl-CoA thioesterase [Opitutae bacterium]
MKEKFHLLPEFRVRFAETDMAGVVHFSQILRWAENAESDFFRCRGVDFATVAGGKLRGFPRVKLQAEFVAPARYDDRIVVKIRPLLSGRDGGEKSSAISWEFVIVAARGDNGGGCDNVEIARGRWTSVYAEADVAAGTLRRVRELPAEIVRALSEFARDNPAIE